MALFAKVAEPFIPFSPRKRRAVGRRELASGREGDAGHPAGRSRREGAGGPLQKGEDTRSREWRERFGGPERRLLRLYAWRPGCLMSRVRHGAAVDGSPASMKRLRALSQIMWADTKDDRQACVADPAKRCSSSHSAAAGPSAMDSMRPDRTWGAPAPATARRCPATWPDRDQDEAGRPGVWPSAPAAPRRCRGLARRSARLAQSRHLPAHPQQRAAARQQEARRSWVVTAQVISMITAALCQHDGLLALALR